MKLSSIKGNDDQKNFVAYSDGLFFERLKMVSFMLIFTYPGFLYSDLFLLNNVTDQVYRWVLASIHLTGFFLSIIFLLSYYFYKNAPKGPIIHLYIVLFLFIGATASINSQLLNGNLYAYIIILLGVSVIFPIHPGTLLIYLCSVHIYFLIGLFFIDPNHLSLITKMINSTGAAVISFTIAFMLYQLRKSDFENKCKLRRNSKSFRRLFHMNPYPLILTNLQNDEILLINQQAIEYYHLQDQDMAKIDGKFLFTNPFEKQTILKMLGEHQSIKNYELEYQVSPNLKKWAMLSLELVEYLDQSCILIGVTDITNLKIKEEELLKHASFDTLTGVMNRRSGMLLLEEKIQGSYQQEFIVCYIDINGLKTVNDNFGHSAGDDLIKTSCEIINRNIDAGDVLFRMGGDEFIIVFSGKDREKVEEIWANIKQEFQSFNQSAQQPYELSASHATVSPIISPAQLPLWRKS
ncbi:GGDEF domain-containing protein [Ferdinandcohnia quinoae]|uniref:Sensor domain-containing diguanylate cyclase n=1 Tax=Fredinandcohnia quinoae TaxID=2918902 RepID=A0AAW5E3Y2_9BACI|nr:sensor domain-containing diguanylate cyclase [Fredinandcohnia sp. SECRCQ15]MCH1627188.1 sensor domain-containing diguanylate cyclase [Fredinandcohnia sp. SECRCQ15]